MDMSQSTIFLRFAVSLGIGFLIGLQREYAHGGGKRNITAGERTFSLVSLGGTLAAMLADTLKSPWILMGAMGLVGVYSAIGYAIEGWRQERVGITTEVSVVIAFLIGPLCYWGELTLAVAIGIATTVMLSLKIPTDKFVRALTQTDITAALQLAVISAIVLPILPNQSFLPAPLDVLNPFRIWLMVVFISSVSFLGYALIKVVGPDRGIGLTGILGGIVSSTAVTMSFASRSKENDGQHSRRIGQAIMLSWVIMLVRMLFEVSALNLKLLESIWMPVVMIGIVGVIYSVYLYFYDRDVQIVEMEFNNPFSLATAVKFGLVYAAVLVVSSTAQHFFGETGIILSSILSGMINVSAITLSLAQLATSGGISLALAGRALVYVIMANTLTKGVIVYSSGSPQLKRAIVPGALLTLVISVVTLFFI